MNRMRLCPPAKLVAVLLLSASVLHGQAKPLEGIVRNSLGATRRELAAACPPFVLQAPMEFESLPIDSAVVERRCAVDSVYSLPTADGVRWLAAIYRRTVVVPSDSITLALRHVTRDTGVLITSALYSASRRDTSWRTEWMATVDESMIRSIAPAVTPRPDGSALVSVLYCLNGTGGCSQSYLRRLRGRWTEVVEAFWKQIPPIRNGSIGKGAGVDIRSLTGTYGVYAPNDANCCPSRELSIALEQRGDSLVLKTYRIRR